MLLTVTDMVARCDWQTGPLGLVIQLLYCAGGDSIFILAFSTYLVPIFNTFKFITRSGLTKGFN